MALAFREDMTPIRLPLRSPGSRAPGPMRATPHGPTVSLVGASIVHVLLLAGIAAAPLSLAPLALAPVAVSAQNAPTSSVPANAPVVRIARGSHVRVTPRERDALWDGRPFMVAARVDTIVGDVLVAVPDDGSRPLVVSFSRLSSVSVYRTTEAIATAGAVVGALAGGAMYLKWCSRNSEACQRDGEYDPDYPPDSQPPSRAVLSLIGGAIVGGLLGYAVTPREWKPIVLPIEVPAGSGGRGRGMALLVGVTVRTRWE